MYHNRSSFRKKKQTTALIIEFPQKWMILAMLAIKADIGKSKTNSAKKLPPVGIEPGILEPLLWHILCYTFMPSSLS